MFNFLMLLNIGIVILLFFFLINKFFLKNIKYKLLRLFFLNILDIILKLLFIFIKFFYFV